MASAIQNLLDELSWEGKSTAYRGGGAGKENVLTAEVWQALDTLPRTAFLGAVLERAHRVELRSPSDSGASEERPVTPARAAGDFVCEVLCGDRTSDTGSVRIQPDVLLESDETVVVVEAKRIHGGAFQTEQIARNVLVLESVRRGRHGVLLLVLGTPPPIRVKGLGAMDVEDALDAGLTAIRCRDALTPEVEELAVTVAWTTWAEIAHSVSEALESFTNDDADVVRSVRRQGEQLLEAVAFHG